MNKKIYIVAIVAFIVGFLAYMGFVPQTEVTNGDEQNGQNIEATTTATTTEIKETVKTVSAKIDSKRGVVIYSNNTVIGVIPESTIGVPDARFASVHKIGKTGNTFFVVVQHSDNSADFGLISGDVPAYSPLTKHSGVKNVGTGIIFSSAKSYAAFQYVRDGGECKKDLMLGVIDIKTGKLSYPEIKRPYEIGTGKLQAEMGGYRFDGDTTLQFMDMPRACDGSGDYNAQTYYSWNIGTGEVGVMQF